MKLVAIIIDNFQGIATRSRVDLQLFNVLIGRNDVGKSTILKALDLFLNGRSPTFELSNVGVDSGLITIELILDSQNQEVIFDENILTTFESEEIVNPEGHVHIKKVWDTSKSRAKPETFIIRKEYIDEDFLKLTEKQLIALCKKLDIDTHKANGDEFNNVEKRTKLREHKIASGCDFEFVEEKLPTSGTSRMKNIYSALTKILPRFEFFRADTSLSETDTAIQNYFRNLAVDALKEFGMDEAEKSVSAKLNHALQGITSKINDTVPQDEAVRPITSFDWSRVVKTSFATGEEEAGVPLHLRGDGFRRITMMAYFEYLAEEKASEDKRVIFGFEEPETFLHPAAQEQLFEKLQSLSENGYQVIISSHSAIIVSNTQKQDLIHVVKEDGDTRFYCNVDNIVDIALDLGITMDNQFVHLFDTAKVLLLVEGPDDVMALNHTADEYKKNGEIKNKFDEIGVVLIPIGGCDSIKHWVALNLLQQLSKPFYIYLDSDADSDTAISPNRQRLLDYGFIEGDDFSVTRKRMLENYIPSSKLNEFVPNANLTYGDWDHVKKICKSHPLAGHLGGKKVAERHFTKLTYTDLKASFDCPVEGDEFINIYKNVINILPQGS